MGYFYKEICCQELSKIAQSGYTDSHYDVALIHEKNIANSIFVCFPLSIKAVNTLDHLQEMGIPLVCDKWLTLPANPDLLNVDKLYDQNEKKKEKKSSHISPGPGDE